MRLKIMLCLLTVFSSQALFSQGVLLSDQPGEAQSSAILDIRSDEKGLLIPSMTTGERNAIQEPYDGLIIYNITIGHLNVYDSVEDEWQTLEPLRDPPPPPEPVVSVVQSMALTASHFGPSLLHEESVYRADSEPFVYSENTYGAVSAPLYLPAGTIISNITIYFFDSGNAVFSMRVGLRARILGGEDEYFPVIHDTEGGPTSANIQQVSMNVGHTMLANRGYSISVTGAFDEGRGIQGVKIDYTLPTN